MHFIFMCMYESINMDVCADECREPCIINGQIIPTVRLWAMDFETIGALIS